MVSYSSDNPDEPNQVVVWDLPARSIVRQLGTHNDADYPMAFLLADYATSMWVATEETVWLDAGHDTVVTLVDLARSGEAGTPGAPIQFTIADADAYSMAFSPDGSTLAIGFGDGEVGLWDIRNKNAIVAIESPLVAGGSTSYWANVMTYSADGEYVVTAFAGDANCSVNVSWVKPPRQNWSKLLDFDGTAVDISRDGLALAVGENNDGVILYCTH
jgi:WD40 repeat protein